MKDIFIVPPEMSSLGATLAMKMLKKMTANSPPERFECLLKRFGLDGRLIL